MTNVYCEKDGNNYLIHVQGHATGSEKVCAAVSALVYTLHGYLNNTKDVTVTINDIEPCRACSIFKFYGKKVAENIFMLAFVGFKQIEMSNGENISIKYVEI